MVMWCSLQMDQILIYKRFCALCTTKTTGTIYISQKNYVFDWLELNNLKRTKPGGPLVISSLSFFFIFIAKLGVSFFHLVSYFSFANS